VEIHQTNGSNASESYDGSAWTATPALVTATRYAVGCGTQTAALCVGGGPPAPANPGLKTQEYDGSSWTTGGDTATTAYYRAGCGNSNSRISFWWYRHDYCNRRIRWNILDSRWSFRDSKIRICSSRNSNISFSLWW